MKPLANLTNYPSQMTIAERSVSAKPSGYTKVTHRDNKGNIIYENVAALINLGEENILKGWFQGDATNIPSTFKMALSQTSAIEEDATSHSAVTGGGYAKVSIARGAVDLTYGTTGSGTAANSKITTKDCVFTASDTAWTVAKSAVLEAILNSSDKMIAVSDLSTDRNIGNGESLTVSMILTLS